MAQTAYDLISIDDYIRGEERSPVRHEYIDGRVYAMVGASDAHGLIAGSVFAALRGHLRGGPCQVFMADMKVRIRTRAEERFYYPDVLVSCDAGDRARYYREAPCLIVEVLSEATERLDRGEKLEAYRQLASLQEYLLVAQDRPAAELYRRETGWTAEIYGPGEVIHLGSVGLGLPVDQVYEDLEPPFPAPLDSVG